MTTRAQLNISISPETLAKVKARARDEGLSVSALVASWIHRELREWDGPPSLTARLEAVERDLALMMRERGQAN